MKHFIFTLFIAFPIFAIAQNITVSDFYLNESDLTAINEATKVVDDNNEVCALIRIQTTQKGFSFDGGTIGIVKVDESHVGEIWLYVPAGLRRISIRHEHLGSLLDYQFSPVLQQARTYIMKLVSGTSTVHIEQQIQNQYVIVRVNPSNAFVEINGQQYTAENGVASAYLPFGKYEYHVKAKNFHPETGHINVKDPDKKVEIAVSLKPAFGWIEIKSNNVLNGASVYIDDEYMGEIPLIAKPIPSGKHTISVTKARYSSWRSEIQIEDEQTVSVVPNITANFATITLVADKDAEIWWNNSKIGVGSCTMDFDCGDQKFETRKAGHRNNNLVVKVSPASDGTVTLPSPIPIYGSLNIDVKPVGSNVYLDNVLVGTTPLLLQKVLVGEHLLRIAHSGMRSDSRAVDIKEGKTEMVETTLSRELNVLSTRPTITDGHCVVSDEYDVIGRYVFGECKNLRTISISPTISAIELGAFCGCYQLKSISIPQSVKIIEANTFYWCAALKEVTLPEGVTEIKENAFGNCYGLESITMPSTITYIAPSAFTDCKSLKYIYVPEGTISKFKQLLPSSLRSKLKEK